MVTEPSIGYAQPVTSHGQAGSTPGRTGVQHAGMNAARKRHESTALSRLRIRILNV